MFFMDASSLNFLSRNHLSWLRRAQTAAILLESAMTTKKADPDAAKKAEAEKRKLDDELNEALEETFPASDPVKLTQPDPHPERKD